MLKKSFILLLFLLCSTLESTANIEVEFVQTFQKYIQKAEYNKAIVVAKEIIEYTKMKEFSTEREIILSGMYSNLAELYLHVGKKEKSLYYLEKLANVDNQYIYSTNKPSLLNLYGKLSQKMLRIKSYRRAELFQKKAIVLSNDIFGEKSIESATLESLLGNVYYEQGKYIQAYTITKKSYLIMKDILGNENIETIKIGLNVGTYLMYMGRYSESITYQERAIENAKLSVGEHYNFIASMYNSLGLNYLTQGNYIQAKYFLKLALNIKIELKSQDISLFKIYNHLANLYQSLSNYKEADKYLHNALDLYTLLGMKDKEVLLSLYNNLMQLYADNKQFKKAMEYAEKSLMLVDENHPNTAYLYGNIGDLYLLNDNKKKALKYFTQSLFLKNNFFGKGNLTFAHTYLNISNLYISDNNFSLGLKYAEKSLKNLMKQKKEHINLLVWANINKAYAHSQLSQKQKAYIDISKALGYFLKDKNKIFTITNQQEKKYYKNSYDDLLYYYFTISYDYANTIEGKEKQTIYANIFNYWIDFKRSIYNEVNSFKILQEKTTDKNVKERVEQFFVKQRVLARLYQEYSSSNKLFKKQQLKIDLLQKKIAEDEIYLSHTFYEYKKELPKKDITFELLAKKLENDELYLDFAKIEENYYLFTLDSKQIITFKKYAKKETFKIDETIKSIKSETESITKKEYFADIALAHDYYAKLSKLILSKIELEGKNTLLISPDSTLNFFPFEALYDKKNKKYLIENLRIRYVSSVRDFIYKSKSKDVKNNDIVVFSNPDYDDINCSVSDSRGKSFSILKASFNPLPGTQKEAESIQKLFSNTIVFSHEDATEKNLFKIKSPKILHIATHGFFMSHNMGKGSLHKSGLLFSGANRSIINHKSEGIVSGLELAGLELNSTSLVVLSACYSALGRVEDGEGMIGLNDAFSRAGASNILMSLWAVDDDIGAKMMKSFYENIKKGDNYSMALKEAKLNLIKEGIIHPYYWANFILYGKGNLK